MEAHTFIGRGGLDLAKFGTVLFVFGTLALAAAVEASTRKCDMIFNENDEVAVQICQPESPFCFALWKMSNETGGEPRFQKQGCWGSNLVDECKDQCIASKIHDVEKTLFCCCSKDYCNSNVTFIPKEELYVTLSERLGLTHGDFGDQTNEEKSFTFEPIIGVLIVLTFLVVLVFIGMLWMWKKKSIAHKLIVKDVIVRADCEAGEKLMEPINQIDFQVMEPIVLGEEIAKGKFATVCTGRHAGARVALKVFALENREYFENEKYIFQCLGKSCHPNIIGYRGWQVFSTNLILILDRISPGNLRDFLSNEETSIDLPQTLKILKGLAAGLSYLHGENSEGVVISHRDLTSKNVLIDKNLTPYIADFGLSLRIKGSRYYCSGQERQAEFCSLSDAGTLRYMAPELLEGAVNLKDLENSLKQSDIYALALLIWEIVNKSPIAIHSCHVLPYSPELGKDISIEALTRLVVTRRGRPSFTNWCDLPVSRSMRDTLNESWDAEPDARLTALCVLERLSDMSIVLLQNNKNSANCTTPLESVPESSPWTGRNVCMERNLLEENSDKSTQYLLTTSEKHRVNFFGGGHSSSVGTVESLATTNTELSNGSSLQPPQPPPPPINYLQNIRR